MASRSSTPGTRNTTPPHTAEGERRREHWKTSPSTETTSDEGENARLASHRKVEENTPKKRAK
jgi:hypothetical protein